MFSQTFDIGAYQPALDAEQSGKASQQLAIQDGENFFWNARGVQSGFGEDLRSGVEQHGMEHPGEFDIKNIKHFFFASGVYTVDEAGTWTQVLAFNANATHPIYDLDVYEWSQAYVGTRYWFCHPLLNDLVYYDQFDDQWGVFRDTAWEGRLFGVTHADNRLVVLLEDVVTWSHFDRGDLFTLDWQCGSGVQTLGLIRYGQPYAVMPYNNAWLTFTSKGIMSSVPDFSQTLDPDGRRIISGALVYNHDEVAYENLPLGPVAICHMDEKQVMWLSQSGFWQFAPTQGGGAGGVQLYQPMMGRFYKETLIPYASRAGALLDNFKLTWSGDLQWMFCSSRTNPAESYSRAHILQLVMDKWSVFVGEHKTVTSGRVDSEIGAQRVDMRFFGLLLPSSEYARIDLQNNERESWIKFTPMRLQIPDQPVTAETLSSVQGVRVGHSAPAWQAPVKAGLQSSFAAEEPKEHINSRFKLLVASADGADQPLIDEQEYGHLVHRNSKTSQYSLHCTGVDHSLFITAVDEIESYDIRHVEIDYFFAGIK